MKRSPWVTVLVLIAGFGVIFLGGLFYTVRSWTHSEVRIPSSHAILRLKLEGVIMDSTRFLRQLDEYADDKKVRAIVVEINSPGGAVGPSQEIYSELKKVKAELKKPIVVVANGVMASGGYYVAVAADKILVQPGTLTGSIGVIMGFMNLEKLYDWAKVERYSLSTGKFKDSGAEYRAMREDEKQLFQELLSGVWKQFKTAVAEGRNLKPEIVNEYADGRILTGEQAVQLGFADQFGTRKDAYDLAAELAGLGKDYELFDAPKVRSWNIEWLVSDEEGAESKLAVATEKALRRIMGAEHANQPMFLMPGNW